MLSREAVERIRVLSARGLGSKAITKATGISRNTVRKYLSLIRNNEPIVLKTQRPSKLDAYKETIHSWFISCRGHCPVVQRKLQEELKLSISLRMLQKYCRQWRIKEIQSTEIAERYEVPPGDEMQIDFGFDDVVIGGIKTRICIFVAVLSYSRRVFVKVYPTENQIAWFGGIESAFEYFNGVPVAVVSDNTRCLVDSKGEKGKTIFNRSYLQLARYWNFVPVNCRPYRAKTKGKVERMVGYVKTSCLSGLEAIDLPDVQTQVNRWMSTVTDVRVIDGLVGRPIDRFQTEIMALKAYAGPRLGLARIETRKVDASGRIQIDNNHYRISEIDAGTVVDVLIARETITVFIHGQCVKELNRTADRYEVNTFEHKQKEVWEPDPVQDNALGRSLKEYDQFVEESSHVSC